MPTPAWKKTLKDRHHTQARKLTGFSSQKQVKLSVFTGEAQNSSCSSGQTFCTKTEVPKAMRRYFGLSDSPHGEQVTPNIVLLFLKPEAKGKRRGHLTKPPRAMAQHGSCWFIASLLWFIASLCSPGVERRQQKSNKTHTPTLELGDNVSLERQNYFYLLTEGTLCAKNAPYGKHSTAFKSFKRSLPQNDHSF